MRPKISLIPNANLFESDNLLFIFASECFMMVGFSVFHSVLPQPYPFVAKTPEAEAEESSHY